MKSNELIKQILPNGPTSVWFNKEEFTKDDFNVEHFIVECRRRVTLDVLRDDLNLYLKILYNAMIELINKDYADFLNLSTNLVGMDKAINHLIQPLNSIKTEILSVRKVIKETSNTIEEKINQRKKIREKKDKLQCMIKIIQSLDEMENLLGITSDEESQKRNSKHWDVGNDQLIERVASEFNRLQFHVNKSKDLPLVTQIEPRVKVIADTLAFSLAASLKECFTGNDKGDLMSCLRTYASIDKTDQAQSVFRQVVVQDYMQEIINEQTMKEKGLEYIFEKILQFVPKHCSKIKAATSGSMNSVLGYDFIVNAVWPEVVSNLDFRMPSLFAPGDPELFHERYLTSMSFLSKFESLLSSQASVRRLRQHASYLSFMSKWSVSVYFQIRFQDVAGQLEVALLDAFASAADANNQHGFTLASSCVLMKCLRRCWSSDVFLDVLLHRFWRLSLQLMSRYGMWIKEILQEYSQASSSNAIPRVESGSSFQQFHTSQELDVPSSSTSSISPSTSSPSLQAAAAQQSQQHSGTLQPSKEFTALLCDIRKLTAALKDIYMSNICPLLSKHEGINLKLIDDAWKDAEDVLLEHVPDFVRYISNDVAASCCSHLKNVNNIPRLYKHTNREVPKKASSYISSLLKPLTEFLEKKGSSIVNEDKKSLILNVANMTTEQFLSVTTEVLTSARRMEESLKRLKASRGNTSSSGNQGMSDDEKIRLQMYLDVMEYTSQISKLGLENSEVPSLQKLQDIVKEPSSSS